MATDQVLDQANRAEARRWGRIATTAAERGDTQGMKYACRQALKYTNLVLQAEEKGADGATPTPPA